ncbi:MAG: two-component system, OmpR family, alkaline phosphatase synthesis response regulator PhoP [Clostridiales bacterium]|jgi:two-component system alkaline phosphatase synthesis response regulator PhoP|nr:two-component system, OmpR family, alkaline phosphatase synthesis response regulator PhoP [Clostridiales bacterium]MDN5299189.1 two-component system, OmpR family, alkaline phosphatase synthesis response regulator PhoP [Clostridiales bacterium]
MNKYKVLIVDDEIHILELLRYNLESNGFEVVEAETGEQALKIIESQALDCILLDLMLPGIDGIEVLRKLRQSEKASLPVMMLTAKNEEIDAVIGLEMGADDYVGKPFRTRELISRVKAIIRRSEARKVETQVSNIINQEGLIINLETHQIFKDGNEIFLTLKEFELLEKLMKTPGRVFTRDELLESIWGYDYIGETRTVDVHIRQLRKKIEKDDKNPELILTVRGIGYKFKQ